MWVPNTDRYISQPACYEFVEYVMLSFSDLSVDLISSLGS